MVDCPRCGAKAGEKCFQKKGKKRREPNHHQRMNAAQKAAGITNTKPKSKGQRSRRAKRADAFYSSWEWTEVRYKALQLHGRRCMCCGWEPSAASKGKLCVDHIKPRSRYPDLELSLSNLQVLCSQCNRGKSNVHEDDFRSEWHGEEEDETDPLTAQFNATMQ